MRILILLTTTAATVTALYPETPAILYTLRLWFLGV